MMAALRHVVHITQAGVLIGADRIGYVARFVSSAPNTLGADRDLAPCITLQDRPCMALQLVLWVNDSRSAEWPEP